MHRVKVTVVEEALDANNTIATANRADFDRHGVSVINFMSAPGAGKTTLLERVVAELPGVRVGVLEGDVQGSMDADRLASLHMPVTQINTDPSFGGECHLDANMVRSAIPSLPLDEIDLLVVENVGNLVCPAEFRVGEDARVMVSAVTEGIDKPLKYPLMFRACQLVLVNKIDLLPHLDVDLDHLLYNIDQVHPDVERIVLSARTGDGVDAWRDWLTQIATRAGGAWPDERHRHRRPTAARAGRAARRAHRGQRPVLSRRGRASGTAVSPHGRALRPRRAAGGIRPLSRGALGRPSRRRRVRPPGDRRQARAAGDRPGRRRAASSPIIQVRAAGRRRRHRDRLRRRRGRKARPPRRSRWRASVAA